MEKKGARHHRGEPRSAPPGEQTRLLVNLGAVVSRGRKSGLLSARLVLRMAVVRLGASRGTADLFQKKPPRLPGAAERHGLAALVRRACWTSECPAPFELVGIEPTFSCSAFGLRRQRLPLPVRPAQRPDGPRAPGRASSSHRSDRYGDRISPNLGRPRVRRRCPT